MLSRHSKHWGCLLLLLVCTTYPAYRPQYIRRGWADDWTCAGFATLRYINAFAAWMALGFVAFSRFCITNSAV